MTLSPRTRINDMAENVGRGLARTSPLFLSAIGPLLLLLALSFRPTFAQVPGDHDVGHVRHKRTVSDFVDGLMSAMYFRAQDPLPLPSTVITRITHVPATSSRVYKYIPVQTLKLSKLRARQITEPVKIKLKYPKKFSIKTEDSMTLLKNDLPWTLHPLPPPLPTSKTIKVEMGKSMPWALHPLPPPVKTKNYSDYYWPEVKTRPKHYYMYKSPTKPYRVANNNYKYFGAKPSYKPTDLDYKPVNDKPAEYKPDEYNSDEYNHVDDKHVDYKHVDYKAPDYKSPDYKSPDYKSEYSNNIVEDEHRSHHYYSNDDHANMNDSPSPSSSSHPPVSTEYVSHISIEPSVQIASFSETELQSDGSTRESVSQADNDNQRCQCTINGHRHKRDTTGSERKINGTGNSDNTITTTVATTRTRDLVAELSTRNSYVTPNVGHATDVQIIKSHDITDQSVINDPNQQQVHNLNAPAVAAGLRPAVINREKSVMFNATFRDENDKFKVDFGRDVNAWDESKSDVADRGPRFSPIKSDYDDFKLDSHDDDAYSTNDKPSPGRGYHITKSKVENSDRGVAFSVQTPFSVSSFSSNVRHPGTDERRSQFRYTELKTTSSPLLASFQSTEPNSEQPLDFEQFGLQSALFDDRPSSGSHFSIGFGDKEPENIGQLTSGFFENFGDRPSDFAGRFTSQFSRDHDRNRGSTEPFHYDSTRYGGRSSQSDRFNGRRLKDRRPSSKDAVLEYFQPVVIDFDKSKNNKDDFLPFGNNQNDKSRFFGKTDSTGFSKLKNNQNFDQLRLPGRLHESNENLSRKMHFHPSTFDIEKR